MTALTLAVEAMPTALAAYNNKEVLATIPLASPREALKSALKLTQSITIVESSEKLLQMSKQLTGKKPMTFITDGLPSYHDSYKKEFWTLKGPRTEHIRHITLRGDHNNNKMERMNGEVRDREKVLRGLKKDDSVMLSGYQLYHNYFRPHEGLDGKTPSEACGIQIEGKNKWKTLIQNASKVANNRKL